MMGGQMGQMGGKGPMMANPMMGGARPMMGPGAPMMGMMGNPQMMRMMQQKGNPQMAGMMGKGGMPGMPGMMPGMMGKGGMPQMQGAPQAARPPMPQQQQPMQAAPQGGQPFNAATLAAAPPAVQKQMIGEKIFPLIAKIQPDMAGKVTGMMLEMDNSELLMLLESEQQLRSKVNEALLV